MCMYTHTYTSYLSIISSGRLRVFYVPGTQVENVYSCFKTERKKGSISALKKVKLQWV